MSKKDLYEKIFDQKEQLTDLLTEYWQHYAHMGTWYFWSNLAILLIPLVVLYFAVDKKRLFEILFYGYSIHVLWSYTDIILSMNNYLVHPHTLFVVLPIGFTVSVSLIPVVQMLIYQYCTNNKKNFYLYAAISALFLSAFGLISESVGLFKLHKGMNHIYLYFLGLVLAYVAYWATKLFIKFKNTKTKQVI